MEDHALCQPDMQVHWSHSLHQIDHGHLGEETIHELQGLKLRWHHVHAALVTQRESSSERERERVITIGRVSTVVSVLSCKWASPFVRSNVATSTCFVNGRVKHSCHVLRTHA